MKEYDGVPGCQAGTESDSERPVMTLEQLKEKMISPEG